MLIKKNSLRKGILLLASYYFYAYWDLRFLPLLLVPTLVDFNIGKKLNIYQGKRARNILITVSITVNLLILGFFKYYNFFIDSFKIMLNPLGIDLETMDILLPLGISFFTFSTLTYTIDVYRQKIEPCKSILDYALFIAFFPKLIAGPISRASHLLPQFRQVAPIDNDRLFRGLTLMVSGLFIKVFLADRLALYVDPIFQSPNVYSWITLWCGSIAYSLQIYFDFAGYSQMAIGFAALLGYDLEKNFDFPYLSKNISEFWRRWHITLSNWIRDYIYIPLGGNRKGRCRTYFNLLLAMALCGLWHGAAWTFVFWGVFHGMALAFHRLYKNFSIGNNQAFFIQNMANWALTTCIVVLGWVFFRAEDFTNAWQMLQGMFIFQNGFIWIYPFFVFVLLSTILLHIIHYTGITQFHLLPQNAWYTPAVIISLLLLTIIFKPEGFNPFIYAQF